MRLKPSGIGGFFPLVKTNGNRCIIQDTGKQETSIGVEQTSVCFICAVMNNPPQADGLKTNHEQSATGGQAKNEQRNYGKD